ncbi:hypothetical protein HBE96_23355 [Clostridium sp. P21]|uniref:SF3 helicase domain-containing protein n=1 Tax=Clostridium muellerianum TaxID=2716538 RepID=A0A7Y0EL80_9CLOT|nr:hypothetical protein [Clostridium muellerianum]
MDKLKLIEAEKAFYIKHFGGAQNQSLQKITTKKNGDLTSTGDSNRGKLRRMLDEDGYENLITHLKTEFKNTIAITQGGIITNLDALKDYLAALETDRTTKSATDELDMNRAEWLAAQILANTEIVIEVTPRSALNRTDTPSEEIRFVENNMAVAACTSPDNGMPITLETFLTGAGAYSCMAEVKALLKASAPKISSEYNEWRTRVPMANGIYDIKTGVLHPYPGKEAKVQDRLIPYRIELNYVPNGQLTGKPAELLEKVFLRRKQLIDVFCCFLGIGMSTWLGAQVCLILKGEGASNGKSTITGLAPHLVGKNYIAKEQLKDIFAKEHGKTNLAFKLINVCDDLNEDSIRNQGDFNSLVTDEHLRIAPKGQDQYYVPNWLTCIYNGNVIPRIGSAAGANGVLRRIVVLPMDAKFSIDCTEDDYDTGVFMCDPGAIDCEYEKEEIEQLASYCLSLLTKEFNKRGSVIDIHIPEIRDELKAYYADLDSVFFYLDENGFINDPAKLDRKPVADVYAEYVSFVGSGGKPLAIKGFGKRLRNLLPDFEVKAIKGDKCYIWKGDKKDE